MIELKLKNISNKNSEFHDYSILDAIITREGNRFCSLCLDLDIASEGDTINDAKENLLEAIEGYIESALEFDIPLLREVPFEDNPLHADKSSVIEVFKIVCPISLEQYA